MKETWTILKLINWTTDYLSKKGVETARLDGELLLAHLLGTDRTRLYMNFDQPLTETELARFRELVQRRAKREPLQYITGCQEFWSMPFKVSPAVLIPRPETELLVEEGVKEVKTAFPGKKPLKILDIGTGSGAVAAALAKEIEEAAVTGIDFSTEAVTIARENMKMNGLSSSVTIVEGHLFEPVENEKFHLVVSNPPYIPHDDLKTLQPEVSDFEPITALDGGEDGLDFYRKIIPEAPDYLVKGGWLIMEHGIGQSLDIIEMLNETGAFDKISSLKDYAGIDRVIKGRKK